MVTSESTAAQNVNLTKVLGVIISEKFFFSLLLNCRHWAFDSHAEALFYLFVLK